MTAHQGHPFTVADSDDGDPWRVLVFPGRVAGTDQGVNIAVALPLTGATRTVSDFRTIAFVVSAGVLVLGALFAVLAIRRSFRPLDDIERTASAIAGGDLSRRVPDAPASTEIGRLSTALNTMLSQIETSFRAQQRSEEQMRRFVADASHELRTPLAAIRGFAELYRQGAVRDARTTWRTSWAASRASRPGSASSSRTSWPSPGSTRPSAPGRRGGNRWTSSSWPPTPSTTRGRSPRPHGPAHGVARR